MTELDSRERQVRAGRLYRLRQYVQAGDLRAAFRKFTGLSTTAMAKQLQQRRSDVSAALDPAHPRRYAAILRELEAAYRLPAYSLDTLLQELASAPKE